MFVLYKNEIPLLYGCIEDLEYFVEELKRLNPKEVDRREFKIISKNGYDEIISKNGYDEVLREWHRK